MNIESNDRLTIEITSVLTISRGELEQLFTRAFQPRPASTPNVRLPARDSSPSPMGFTVKQTAKLLGVANITVYRLLKRGLLRSSSALRKKLISKSEIERFLKETTESSY